MKNFDTRVYNISDFIEWNTREQIQLSPDFQRRSVWSLQAKSYLIDTIIRGKPMPKLLLMQDVKDRRNIRVVVDGQQRLRAILEYVEGGFAISRAHNREHAGARFDDLPEEVQSDLLKYEIGVDLLYDLPYGDLLDIFARLNTYTVKLNSQELLNAKYVGYFKQLAYRLGYRYVEYLLAAHVISKAQVTRMSEAQLTSDLLVAITDGVQTSKNIENYYRKYEDQFNEIDIVEKKFDAVMAYINAIYPPEELASTNWTRLHLFYTLFTSVGHGLSGLEGLKRQHTGRLCQRQRWESIRDQQAVSWRQARTLRRRYPRAVCHALAGRLSRRRDVRSPGDPAGHPPHPAGPGRRRATPRSRVRRREPVAVSDRREFGCATRVAVLASSRQGREGPGLRDTHGQLEADRATERRRRPGIRRAL